MKKFWPWPGMIFVLLGSNVVIVATTVTASIRSRGAGEIVASELPLRWNDSAEQHARNSLLGWRIVLNRHTLVLTDGAGRPIRAAKVYLANEDGTLDAPCAAGEPGEFMIPAERPLPEQLRVVVIAGLDVFTTSIETAPRSTP